MPNRISMGPVGFFGLAFGLILTMIGSYWVGQRNTDIDAMTTYTQKFNQYQDSIVKPMITLTDSLQRSSAKAKASADSIGIIADKQTKEINKLSRTIVNLHQSNKTLSDSILKDTTLPPSCDQCRRAVITLNSEVDSLNILVSNQEQRDSTRLQTINNLNISLHDSNARGDSLRTVIINFPKPPAPKKILGITLPNIPDKYLFLGGVGLGFVLKR